MAKILVTMPDDFLNKVDGLALTEQRSRSELIREALRTYMRRISASQAKGAYRLNSLTKASTHFTRWVNSYGFGIYKSAPQFKTVSLS